MFGFLSNTLNLTFFVFILNHIINASLESAVYPLSIFAYSLLEYPRPSSSYFRFMLLYTQAVILLKFLFQLSVWQLIFSQDFLSSYSDTGKIGFNRYENTYNQSFLSYVILDALCMLAIFGHEYFLLRTGLSNSTETDIESLQEAYNRHGIYDDNLSWRAESYETHSTHNYLFRLRGFIYRLMPTNKLEKPGYDLYTPLILIQLLLFIYLMFLFPQMDGNHRTNSNVFQTNSFPGRMVIALLFHLFVMILDRFLYLKSTGKKKKDQKNLGWEWRSIGRFSTHLVLLFTIHALVF